MAIFDDRPVVTDLPSAVFANVDYWFELAISLWLNSTNTKPSMGWTDYEVLGKTRPGVEVPESHATLAPPDVEDSTFSGQLNSLNNHSCLEFPCLTRKLCKTFYCCTTVSLRR